MSTDGANSTAFIRSLTSSQLGHAAEHILNARENETSRCEAAKRVLEGQREVLSRLRKWHLWDVERHESPSRYLLSKIGYSKRPPRPSDGELKSLAAYFFPPRVSLIVTVCDFGLDRFERTDTNLGNLENCTVPSLKSWWPELIKCILVVWCTKPAWSIVRWMYVSVIYMGFC